MNALVVHQVRDPDSEAVARAVASGLSALGGVWVRVVDSDSAPPAVHDLDLLVLGETPHGRGAHDHLCGPCAWYRTTVGTPPPTLQAARYVTSTRRPRWFPDPPTGAVLLPAAWFWRPTDAHAIPAEELERATAWAIGLRDACLAALGSDD